MQYKILELISIIIIYDIILYEKSSSLSIINRLLIDLIDLINRLIIDLIDLIDLIDY